MSDTGIGGVTRISSAKREGYLAKRKDVLLCAAVVFLVAAGARIAFLALRGPVMTPDSSDYILLAENIRAHGAFSLELAPPFTPTIRRAPLYPALLSVIPASISALPVRVSLLQALLDSGVAVMVLLLSSMSLSLRWATGAGLTYSLFPGAIYYSTNVLSEPVFTALLVGGVLAMVNGLRKDRFLLTALGGLLLGLATLCRPISLPLPALFVGVSFLIADPSRRWFHYVLLVGCAALVIAPWSARCTRVSDQLVLVQGIAPALFYVATRSDWNQQDEKLWDRFSTENEYGRRLVIARTPKEVADADRLGFRLGLQNIRSNPVGYIKSRLRSFPYLFITSFDPFTGINTSFRTLFREGNLPGLAVKAFLLFFFALAPLALAVIGLLSRRDLSAMLIGTVWLYTLVANLPMWVEYRFWIPAVPFVLVSAAIGLRFVTSRISRPGPVPS